VSDLEAAAALPSLGTTISTRRISAERQNPTRRFLHQLLHSGKGLTGAILVALALFAAATAPVISPHDPLKTAGKGKFAEPGIVGGNRNYLLGGDNLGRDTLSRVLYGSRASLSIGLSVTAIAAICGSLLGALAGFRGGLIDTSIMRLVDLQLSIPFIILAMISFAILGPGFWSVFVALAVALWVNYARLVRGETLKLRAMEYIAAAQAIGVTRSRILFRHILPNVVPSILVLATLDMAFVIVFESSLTFLGLGIQPPTPTWGYMLSEGRNYLQESPWMSIIPGTAIILTVVGINLLGDWLRDTFDPSLRNR
jgi:ABC-type dipeptide/oligopeptide/nickel transport system permease subunit